MFYLYVGCFAFGIFYAVVSALLGGDHGIDSGGIDVDIDVDLDHAGIDGNMDSADAPSPFSPLVIASAITTFGAAGLIGKIGFGMGNIVSSLFALVIAGIIGTLMFFGVVKLMYSSQSNSTFSQNDLIGMEAKILTPVPENGLGEIAIIANGIRYTFTAKSAYNERINRGDTVIIKEIKDNIAMVARKITIDDLDLIEVNKRKTDEKENI